MAAAAFIYDGDCAFCSSSARFLRRYAPSEAELVPWQRVNLPEIGLTERECADSVRWVGADGSRGAGPVAIGHLLCTARWYWRPVGRVLRTPPGRWLAWPVYRWVARNRHRLPGGTPACSVPVRGA
jgi:predicted DCC family thiol-disulfide oxidoreductase YuxK